MTGPGGPARAGAVAEVLRARLAAREAVLGVVGLGYVGLPVALTFAERGFRVLGFDVDPAKPAAIGRGESYIHHLDAGRIRASVDARRLEATTDFARLSEPDVLILCVPTPLTRQREPDMRYVSGTVESVAQTLRRGQLVVLESTTYPGTTEELVRPRLERTGLRAGEDFFLAFSPEREDPGNPVYTTERIPKVIGGIDALSGDLTEALYGAAFERTVRVSSAAAAEAAKLTENIFRAINIALVNELKVVYDRMGIDIWEVLDAAATKPFGFMRFNPGPGWGGHCIPVDPFYLSWKAREFGVPPKFIELAGEVNVEMPRWVVDKLVLALNERGRAVRGANVLLLGVAYKKDVDDARESPAFVLMDLLGRLGAELAYHDPYIPELPRTRAWSHLPRLTSVPLDAATLRRADAVLVVTDHTPIDYGLVLREARLVVDTRGVYREASPNVVRA